MKTTRIMLLIFSIVAYSFSCGDKNKSSQALTVTYDTITLNADSTYDTIPNNFIGFSYPKIMLKRNRFFSDSFLIHLYANFNHAGFIRLGGTNVDSGILHTDTLSADRALYYVFENSHIETFKNFLKISCYLFNSLM